MSTLYSLRARILDFVNFARNMPGRASAPEELNALEKAAYNSADGMFAAEHAPIAPMTWEERVILLGSSLISERVSFKFPYAMEVVGMFPTLSLVQPLSGGAVVPTTADIDISIDLNNNNFLSALDGISTSAPGATRGGTFVTLAAWSVLAPRLISLKLTGPAPELGMTFRWKNPNANAPNYRDTIVSCAIFVRRLDGQDSANVVRGAREL
jgi:hypothetical protein